MTNFFNTDGVIHKVSTLICDILILSLLWLFFSIPLVTIGASTTALFFFTTRRISNREGTLWRDFWNSFKSNFKQATLIWLMIVAVGFLLFVSVSSINAIDNPTLRILILFMQIPMIIEFILVSLYIFPILSRFEVSLGEVLKSAFTMANRHILTSISFLVIALTVILAASFFPIFFLVGIGVYAYFSSFLFMRVFRKYRPEIDTAYRVPQTLEEGSEMLEAGADA